MHGYRLLIVDDDAVDRRNLVKLLQQGGSEDCHIHQAEDGAAGLLALRTDQFDCVLLDFNLSDMNGFEFLTAAAIDGKPPCAVVLVTGQGNEALAVEAMKRGAQDYLVKDQMNTTNLWSSVMHAVNQEGLQRRLTGTLHDLTASNVALEQEVSIRKEAEAELRVAKEFADLANQAKTRFVAMVTHELRTPLNGILGYAQLLRIESKLSARQDAHVRAMMQAGRHLLAMIERVLDFASIEAARMVLRPVTVSIREVTDGCIAFISPMATERGLSLRVIRSHNAPQQIVADPARLSQVLLNLLGNAVKFTETGGVELHLLAGTTLEGVRFEIVDTGQGVNEVSRKKLFQDFERFDTVTSVEGTGLGLAISARIIRLMGGTISFVPNPGGGSIFWFELPTGVGALPVPPEPAKDAPSLSGQKVLLVDDIKINRDIIGAFLGAAGHVVTLAEGGKEAVRLAAELQFDLILMDIRMPEMDGLEATRRIRALPGQCGQVPILALTAYTFPDQMAQCTDAGMDGHVAKPVDYQTLMTAIDRAITAAAAIRFAADGGVAHPPDVPGGHSPPRFDRAVLDQTMALLPPGSAGATLQSLRDRKERMLRLLDRPTDRAEQADAAHELASAAGMFGFTALSTVSRDFERAMIQHATGTDALAEQLRGETYAAVAELDAVVRETRGQPA
jgi:signal transduction histidine kinase